MSITRTIGYFMHICLWINTNGGAVDGVIVSLSKSPDQVQAGSTLSLTCSVDEDPNPLALVQFQRNNFVIVVVSPVATCFKTVVGTDVYNLTCDPNNRWFRLDVLNVDSNSHGDNWTCDMVSGAGGPCLGNPNPCASGPVSVFIPVPVTTVRLTYNNDVSVTSPVDASESSNGLTLKCNTGPTGSRPVADITWWKTGDVVSPERITANVTSLTATSLGNDIYISNTRLVIGDRSYNGLKVYCTASQVTSGEVQLNVKWRPDVSLQIGGQSYTVYKVSESQTNIVFTCTSGPVNPAITGYSWRQNSTVIMNEVTNTYTIAYVSQSYDGLYTCSATNLEGIGRSVEMELDVLYEPSVDAMASVFLEENERLYKICSGRGNPTPSFHWTFGSQILSDNAVLEIQIIFSDQSGIYTCHASNTVAPSVGPVVDKTTSTTLNVTVYYGPKNVNVSPLNLGIEEGQRTTTSSICSADCKPTCEYRWYKNGQTNPVVVGNTLDLGIVNRNKTGNYTCEAHNRFLNRNRSQRTDVHVQVQIYFPPEVKLQPDQNISPPPTPYRILLGQTNVRLRCLLYQANPQPTSYTWMFNSTEITGENQATFNIQNVALQNHGTFGCRANNGIRTPSFSYLQVDVDYGPIITPINNQTKEEGSQLTMPCQYTANPPANIIRWSKINNSTFRVNEATLTIQQLDRTDTGLYMCYAQNTLFLSGGPSTGEMKTSSEDMYLDVQYKPTITSLQIKGGNVINESDTNTRIVCEVESNPVSHILWTRGHNHSSLTDTGKSIVIPKAQCSDTTLFTCTASNGVGSTVRKSVSLYVNCQPRIDPNNPPETTVYGAIGESIHVTVQDIIAYPPPTFTWKKVDTDRLPPSNQTDTNTSSTLTLHQLEMRTFGNYSVTMHNNIGGPIITFVTVKLAEHPLTPSDLDVVATDFNAAYLIWVPAINTGSQQSFIVQYRRIEDLEFSNYTANFTDHGHVFVLATIDGLQENTAYIFRVLSRNRYGDSPVTEEVRDKTKSKLEAFEPVSLTGPVVGAALGGGFFATVVILFTVCMWSRFKESRSYTEKTNRRTENQPSTDHDVPVYTNLELNQSPARRDQQVYEELTQDRDVSTSAYQSLNINDSPHTV